MEHHEEMQAEAKARREHENAARIQAIARGKIARKRTAKLKQEKADAKAKAEAQAQKSAKVAAEKKDALAFAEAKKVVDKYIVEKKEAKL